MSLYCCDLSKDSTEIGFLDEKLKPISIKDYQVPVKFEVIDDYNLNAYVIKPSSEDSKDLKNFNKFSRDALVLSIDGIDVFKVVLHDADTSKKKQLYKILHKRNVIRNKIFKFKSRELLNEYHWLPRHYYIEFINAEVEKGDYDYLIGIRYNFPSLEYKNDWVINKNTDFSNSVDERAKISNLYGKKWTEYNEKVSLYSKSYRPIYYNLSDNIIWSIVPKKEYEIANPFTEVDGFLMPKFFTTSNTL